MTRSNRGVSRMLEGSRPVTMRGRGPCRLRSRSSRCAAPPASGSIGATPSRAVPPLPPGHAVPRAAVTTAAIARILARVVAATNAYKHCGDWPLTEPSGGGVMDGGGRRVKGEGE